MDLTRLSASSAMSWLDLTSKKSCDGHVCCSIDEFLQITMGEPLPERLEMDYHVSIFFLWRAREVVHDERKHHAMVHHNQMNVHATFYHIRRHQELQRKNILLTEYNYKTLPNIITCYGRNFCL
jgi:hypothetical protein